MARLNTRSQAASKQDDNGTRARTGTRLQRLTERYVSPPPSTLKERRREEEGRTPTTTKTKTKKTLFDESPEAPPAKHQLGRTKSAKSRTKTLSEQQFDIFADSDGTAERETPKAKKETPLKLARTNSMILPLPQQQQQPRARTSRKSELYNYDKENDPLEEELDPEPEPTSLSRNPSDASSARSPTRSRNGNTQQFTRYRQQQQHGSEDESDDESSNSLDDFIVSDNDEPSFHEESSEGDSEAGGEEHKASPPPPPTPPTQRRRLFRGRRPNPAVDLENALRESARRPDLRLEPSLPAAFAIPSPPKQDSVSKKLFQKETDMSEELDRLNLQDNDASIQLQDDLVG